MTSQTNIRRAVIVVLDGLRPDAIDAYDLANVRHVITSGASSTAARTVEPPVTAAAMTSLLTGVAPAKHRIVSDHIFIPRSAGALDPLPQTLADADFPSSAFLGDIPTIFKGVGARVGRRLGFGTVRFSGRNAAEILAAAKTTLRAQRRGLILLHWPDADRAGHDAGWMSPAYAAGCRQLDHSLGNLYASLDLASDPSTMLVILADHGGGGIELKNHESDHPLDVTIPIAFAGPGIMRSRLPSASLLDVPATTLFALGVPVPASYGGRVHTDHFAVAHAAVA